MRVQNYREGESLWPGALVLLALTLFIAFIGLTVFRQVNHHTVNFTVQKTERITTAKEDGQSSSKYLVFTDKGVYENTDSLLNWKWDSSNLYAQLTTGKKYSCDAVGFRVPSLSWYENLISCRGATKNAK